MSGTPPPNYNPNDSLLSGGETAKILPVQGGGSMIPGGTYNANASLLSGGDDAKIIPVQGGGQPPGSLESIPEGNNEGTNNQTNDDFDSEAFSTIGESNVDENTNVDSFEFNNEMSNEDNTNDDETNDETNDQTNDRSSEAVDDDMPKVKEIPCPEPDSKELEDLEDSFTANDEAVEVKTTETVRLQAQEFILRKPKSKQIGSDEKDDVMEDWKSGVFTESEADFLNLLGLSPKLLYSSFSCLDRDWTSELANFLYYLTVMTCYPMRNVMTKGDCQHVREFLLIVESNLKAQKLRKLAERPIPVVGPISLSELEEEENEDEDEDDGNEDTNTHASVLNRLKGISVETSKEVKSFTRKVKNYLSKLKFPSLFKKMKEEQEEGEFPEEVNVGENVDNEGNIIPVVAVVSNQQTEPQKSREEIEREYAEKLRELEIRKAMEGLPKEYQTETYRQYINRELRKHGFKEGNFNT